VYSVWYRDYSEGGIDEIPLEPDYRSLTLEQLVSATRGHKVTHMAIEGDIPPLHPIAPDLKVLKVIYNTGSAKLER
jgi:hypothetical protein